MRKRIIITIVVLLTAAGITYLYTSYKSPSHLSSEKVVVAPPKQLSVSPVLPQTGWKKGKSQSVSLTASDIPQNMVAYTLTLRFDPKVLKVEAVNSGHVFQTSNVLQNKIDNTNGKVVLAVGRDFKTTTDPKQPIITILVTPLGVGETDLIVQEASAMTVDQQLYTISVPPIHLSIK
jgi:hypothetical protein